MGDMKRASRRTPGKKRSARHAEDYLSDIEALTVKLDNGKVVIFNLADELRSPSDPVELMKAARRAPERLAFWGYQAAMARAAMKEAERQYDLAYAKADMIQRHSLSESSGEYTERVIRSLVEHSDFPDVQADAKSRRKEYIEAERNYEVLRAVANAVEHRSNTLRALVRKRDND